ncbi:MAG: DUF1552 domain-containing protein [Pirellulales bacterium]|nr:DUF1552 domain-containing protein [Pirellulales bacterium]
MSQSWRISRRTVLKGLGTTVALPLLDAMQPLRVLAGEASAASATPPLRMAFFFVPNGVHMPDWTPATDGADFELPATLQPLAAYREYMTVLTGLAHDKAKANGDGPGDHARSAACFLTASQPFKTSGANIKVGVSVDQYAAQQIGQTTRFPSLELGIERGLQAGGCDSGYSCAYSSNISWRTESTPMGKEIDPKLVFERLFGGPDEAESREARHQRDRYRKSVLDFVRDDASRLQRRLGKTDNRKLEEYLSGVRELELRIQRAGEEVAIEQPDMEKPTGIPKGDYQQHLRLMADILALAFQGDHTRIATFMLANEGSNRPYPFLEVREGHHDLSHHGNDEAKQVKISKINLFHMEQFAYFVERLAAIKEGEGNVLDHSMILYGSGIGDGNRHNHDDLPLLLMGKANGKLSPGRHLRYEPNTPVANLFLSLLDRADVKIDTMGDATGRLENLSV